MLFALTKKRTHCMSILISLLKFLRKILKLHFLRKRGDQRRLIIHVYTSIVLQEGGTSTKIGLFWIGREEG